MKNVFKCIFPIWIVITFILLFYCSSLGKTNFIILLVGQWFFIFSLLFYIEENKSEKKTNKKFILFLLLIGIMGIVMPIAMEITNYLKISVEWGKIYALLGGNIFIIFGTMFLIISNENVNKYNKLYNTQVEAEVIDFIERFDSNTDGPGNKIYSPVFKYNYEDKIYTSYNKELFTNLGLPKIGDKVKIMIDSKNPENIYMPNGSAGCLAYFLSLISIGVGIFICLAIIPQL